jgi:molybdopterin synthase sulfur carrier subunit
MSIHIRYFAALRETVGQGEETLDLPAGTTVAEVRTLLLDRYPALTGTLERSAVAINRSYGTIQEVLHDGDELAFIPPVGGG